MFINFAIYLFSASTKTAVHVKETVSQVVDFNYGRE